MQRRQPDRPQRHFARPCRAGAQVCAAAVQLQVAVLRLVLWREQQDRGQRAAHVRVRRVNRIILSTCQIQIYFPARTSRVNVISRRGLAGRKNIA